MIHFFIYALSITAVLGIIQWLTEERGRDLDADWVSEHQRELDYAMAKVAEGIKAGRYR